LFDVAQLFGEMLAEVNAKSFVFIVKLCKIIGYVVVILAISDSLQYQSIEKVLSLLVCVEFMVDHLEVLPTVKLADHFVMVGYYFSIALSNCLQITILHVKTLI
jgi:hypothetical protein